MIDIIYKELSNLDNKLNVISENRVQENEIKENLNLINSF